MTNTDIKEISEAMDNWMELAKMVLERILHDDVALSLLAKVQRKYYNFLVYEGFSEQSAIELMKGINAAAVKK